MNGLHLLVGIIVLMAVFVGVIIFATEERAATCESRGGVYVYKIHKCMKKEYFIDIN